MYKILVADDEPIERAVVKKILEKGLDEEVKLFFAGNGREAVETYRRENCDIALLDIAMPGINGLEAAEQIRACDPRGIIIFLTAFDEFDYARKAILVQALDFLLKPVDESELITAVEEGMRILDLRVSRQQNQERNSGGDENLDGRLSAIRRQITEYLEENYMKDISLTDIAMKMNYSDPYFCKVFKSCFNKGFILYLTELRIEKSKVLLADVTVNVKDISSRVGFRDSNYYTKVFKRMEGVTPSEYRQMRL